MRVGERASALADNPHAPAPKSLIAYGPLVDLAAADPTLMDCLRAFRSLQRQRHLADYDHDAGFDKASLLAACTDAERAIAALGAAGPAAREAFFTMLTVDRRDFAARS